MKFELMRFLHQPRPRSTIEVLDASAGDNAVVPFDREQNVSRKAIKDSLLEALQNPGWLPYFGQMAGQALMIYPEMNSELPLNSAARQQILDTLSLLQQQEPNALSDLEVVEHALSLRMAFPESPFDQQETHKFQSWAQDKLLSFSKEGDWLIWCMYAMPLLATYPDKRKQFGIDDAWDEARQYLDTLVDNKSEYVRMAGLLSILFPGKNAELRITRQQWKNYIKFLEKFDRSLGQAVYIRYALCGYAASVQRFEIRTDGQCIVTPHQPNMLGPKPLPHRPRA